MATQESSWVLVGPLATIDSTTMTVQHRGSRNQKLMLPSPWRPQTTMAIEKLNRAAREAQPTVISMARRFRGGTTLPRLIHQ